MSSVDQLHKLKDLLDSGVITKEEFQEEKKKNIEEKEVSVKKKQESEEFKKTKKKHKIVFFIILGVIIVWIAIAWSSDNSSTVPMNNNISVCTSSQIKVESLLKSPTSAKFPVCSSGKYWNANGEYFYEHYVDAENSFGAMIRTSFQCKVWDMNEEKQTYKISCSLIE